VLPVDAGILLAVLVALPLLSLLALASTAAYALARRRGWLPPDCRSLADRPWIRLPAAGVVLLWTGALAWGGLVEVGWVEATRLEFPVEAPVLGERRFRVLHLSDLHLDRIGARERRVIEIVGAAKPHLIVVTGDLMDARGAGPALLEFLGALRAAGAPRGVWLVGGPMDEKFPTRDMAARAGVEWIEDETRLLEAAGGRLRLAAQGAWPARRLTDLLHGLDDRAFTIFLRHSPDGVDDLESARKLGSRVDLFLCGGTHGGQLALPFWGAITTGTRHHKRFERGLYRVEGTPVYVNRGTGTHGLPIRLFARPEAALIELVAPD
jgi:hypothetical protein